MVTKLRHRQHTLYLPGRQQYSSTMRCRSLCSVCLNRCALFMVLATSFNNLHFGIFLWPSPIRSSVRHNLTAVLLTVQCHAVVLGMYVSVDVPFFSGYFSWLSVSVTRCAFFTVGIVTTFIKESALWSFFCGLHTRSSVRHITSTVYSIRTPFLPCDGANKGDFFGYLSNI